MSYNLKEIQEQFNKVIAFNSDIAEPQTDELFARFIEAKSNILSLLDNELIWESPCPIAFELGPKAKEESLKSFLEEVQGYFNGFALYQFIDNCKEGFYTNEVPFDYTATFKIWDKNYIPAGTKTVKIPKGMKMIKAFKYFIDDKEDLTDLQNKASMIIQKDKIEGILCLSIHPLDFLSTSENACNWRSCHSLDGDYRSGNLSYMLDKSTLICYLRSAQEPKTAISNFPQCVPWNNKKWRMLIHLEDNNRGIMLGRQYPFQAEEVLPVIKKIFKEQFNWRLGEFHDIHFSELAINAKGEISSSKENLFDDHSPDEIKVLNDEYLLIGNCIRPINTVIETAHNSLMYNDLIRSTCYKRIWSLKTFADPSVVHWTIGAEVPCLKCGRNHIDDSASFQCYFCSDSDFAGYCDKCGNKLYEDEYIVLEDGSQVCLYCYDKECGRCQNCESFFWGHELTWVPETDVYLCPTCLNEIRQKKKKNSFFKRIDI